MPRMRSAKYHGKVGRVGQNEGADAHGGGGAAGAKPMQRQSTSMVGAMHLLATKRAREDGRKRRALNLILGTRGRRALTRIFIGWREGIVLARQEYENSQRHTAWKKSCRQHPGSEFPCDAHTILIDPGFTLPFAAISTHAVLSAQLQQAHAHAHAAAKPTLLDVPGGEVATPAFPLPLGLGYVHPAMVRQRPQSSGRILPSGVSRPFGGQTSQSNTTSVTTATLQQASSSRPRPVSREFSSQSAPQLLQQSLPARLQQQRHLEEGWQEQRRDSLQEESSTELRGPAVQLATEWHTGRRTIFDARRCMKLHWSMADELPEAAALRAPSPKVGGVAAAATSPAAAAAAARRKRDAWA